MDKRNRPSRAFKLPVKPILEDRGYICQLTIEGNLVEGQLIFPPTPDSSITFYSRDLEEAKETFTTVVDWLLEYYDESYRGVSIYSGQ